MLAGCKRLSKDCGQEGVIQAAQSILLSQNPKSQRWRTTKAEAPTRKRPDIHLPFVEGFVWMYLFTNSFQPNASFSDTTPLISPTPRLRRPSRNVVLFSMLCMSLNSSSGMSLEPNALITSISRPRSASNRCQLSLTRPSLPCISLFFNSANLDGNGALWMPDREGKTLDMSPVGLLGCAEVEVVTRRFGILDIETSLVPTRVQSRHLYILSFIVTSCSLDKSAEGFSVVQDAEDNRLILGTVHSFDTVKSVDNVEGMEPLCIRITNRLH